MNCSVVDVSHLSYSPALMPGNVFVFPKLKTAFKGRRFQNVKVAKKTATAELNAVFLHTPDDGFVHPLERCNKCYHGNRIHGKQNKLVRI